MNGTSQLLNKFAHPLMGPNAISQSDREIMANFVLSGKKLTYGPKIKEFEEKFAKWNNSKHAIFCNSGSSANLLVVEAVRRLYGFKHGICQAVTWSTNVAPVMQLCDDISFCDTDLNTLGPDPKSLTEILKNYRDEFGYHHDNRIFLFVTHLLGYNGLSQEILEILENFNCSLIEDCCEATGATFNGTNVGNFGLAGTFSGYYGHHFTTVEGGIVVTNDDALYEMMLLLRNHGLRRSLPDPDKYPLDGTDPEFTFLVPGFNLRSTEINAVLGIEQLLRLNSIIEHRNTNFNIFVENIDTDKYMVPPNTEGISSFCLPIICQELSLVEKVKQYCKENNIECRPLISGNLLKQPAFKRYWYFNVPNANFLHTRGMYVGNHTEILPEQVKALCEGLNNL